MIDFVRDFVGQFPFPTWWFPTWWFLTHDDDRGFGYLAFLGGVLALALLYAIRPAKRG